MLGYQHGRTTLYNCIILRSLSGSSESDWQVRVCVGQASSARARSAGQVAELLADIGWQLASSSSAVTSQPGRCDVTGLPVSVGGLSSRAQDLHRRVKSFIERQVLPVEHDVMRWNDDPQTKWTVHPTIQQLKVHTHTHTHTLLT